MCPKGNRLKAHVPNKYVTRRGKFEMERFIFHFNPQDGRQRENRKRISSKSGKRPYYLLKHVYSKKKIILKPPENSFRMPRNNPTRQRPFPSTP